jgi:hypothetical protein
MNQLVDGQHVDSGDWEAHGDLRVFVSGTAYVHAYNRSRVMASGRAWVYLHGEARAILCDEAQTRGTDDGPATIVAIGPHTKIKADGHARVEVFAGEATARDEPRILAHRRAMVWAGSPLREARVLADHRTSLAPGTISYHGFIDRAHVRWRAP